MVTQLHFLRHAHAGDAAAWDAPDAIRPLSDKGERQADRMGRFLAKVGLAPDAMITSPKVRAARTAELVAVHLGVGVSTDPRLAGPFDLEDLEAILADAGSPARPVIVGHDPDFSDLLSSLVGAASITMKKGALARVDVDGPLLPGAGTLRWLLPPDLLPDD
jgi:phosphohistidine phosphatase